MIKQLIILFILLSNGINTYSQEIKLGFITGSNLFQRITVNRSTYSPENSYYTFVQNTPTSGLISKSNTINFSYNLGSRISILYKKFTASIEPQFFYKRSHFTFDSPNEISWVIVGKSFRVPFLFTYKVFKSPRSVYFLSGLSITKSKIWDFQNTSVGYQFSTDEIYDGAPLYGVDLFESIVYSKSAYTNFIIGIGQPLKNFDFSLRYMKQLNSKENPIEAKIWQIEFEMCWHILSSKDITKKHFLYVD